MANVLLIEITVNPGNTMITDIREINFDLEDKNLFSVTDIQLKAEALRNYSLPKLKILANELVSRINFVYDINYHEHCSMTYAPHFRTSKNQRKEPVKRDYDHCGFSLAGQRKAEKWYGLDKGTGKLPEIAPANMYTSLTEDGLVSYFHFNYPKGFTKATYTKFFSFLLENLPAFNGLFHQAKFSYRFEYADCVDMAEDLQYKLQNGDYDIIFFYKDCDYPVTADHFEEMLLANIYMFPLFHCFIRISLGEQPQLSTYTERLIARMPEYHQKYSLHTAPVAEANGLQIDIDDIKDKASQKLKVAAGLRWQVFARDSWKCVSCGRSSEDDIILHADHILPRSKGGKDELENYQTLCHICNIGKSNKDNTDLRKKVV